MNFTIGLKNIFFPLINVISKIGVNIGPFIASRIVVELKAQESKGALTQRSYSSRSRSH